MGQGGTRNGGGRNGGLGMLYGKPITPEALEEAKRDYFIFHWERSGSFPDHDHVSSTEIERGAYERLILKAKATELGIHISDEAQVAHADEFLRSLGRDNQAVPMSMFLEKVLQPEGLNAADFQRFMADDLAIDQLIQTLGLSGALVPPQEAAQIYDREHQEAMAQAVFFSSSNYLSKVSVTPAAVSLFYTNYMAHYRLPERVAINYLEYDLTNFLAETEQKIGKTNIAAQASAIYAQRGAEVVPDAKTPEEAKAKIGEMLLRKSAADTAADKARQFLNVLFAMDPVSPENLVTLAKTNGLTVHTTAPFTEADGPDEFPASADLVKVAFKLNADSPFSPKPIAGAEAVYIIGLASQIPSEVPPFSQIHDRVARDYELHEAATRARMAGTNFYYAATVQMATGKTFAQAALANDQTPFAFKPFSLSSQEIPEAEGHADVNEIKRAAFTTQPGHISPFEPTAEGGFVMFVQSLLPVDEAAKKSELPRYLSQLRRGRENEAFSIWLQLEENRELRNTPVFDELTGHKPAPHSP